MVLAVGACRKVNRLEASTHAAITGHQAPQTIDFKRFAIEAEQLAEKCIGSQIENIDATVSEVADEQIASKFTERGGRDRQAPRGIQGPVGGNAAQEVSLKTEGVHEAVASPRHIIVLGPILQRIRYIEP